MWQHGLGLQLWTVRGANFLSFSDFVGEWTLSLLWYPDVLLAVLPYIYIFYRGIGEVPCSSSFSHRMYIGL